MFDAAWLEMPDFALRIAASGCIWNVIVSASHNKTYPLLKCKARGRQSFFIALRSLRFHGAFADFRKCM